MNTPVAHDSAPVDAGREEMNSALFANMVIQQANIAMMMLGKVPHPDTGQIVQDLEAARMFIDQLEMIQAKTKGNLTPKEDNLLRQALSTVQMTFVEAIEGTPAAESIPAHTAPPAAESAAAPTPAQPTPAPAASAPPPDESRKKFSKKY